MQRKPSSASYRQQAIVNKPSSASYRHCEYPFRTETKKCKDACQETSQTASEHATYKSVIVSAAKQSTK
jgi:hypothetical protein